MTPKISIRMAKSSNKGYFEIIFSYMALTTYYRKQLGMEVFLKNIDFFVKLPLSGLFSLSIDIMRQIKKL